jgi:hypothetical protein
MIIILVTLLVLSLLIYLVYQQHHRLRQLEETQHPTSPLSQATRLQLAREVVREAWARVEAEDRAEVPVEVREELDRAILVETNRVMDTVTETTTTQDPPVKTKAIWDKELSPDTEMAIRITNTADLRARVTSITTNTETTNRFSVGNIVRGTWVSSPQYVVVSVYRMWCVVMELIDPHGVPPRLYNARHLRLAEPEEVLNVWSRNERVQSYKEGTEAATRA